MKAKSRRRIAPHDGSTERNDVSTTLQRTIGPHKTPRHGFESLRDILRRYEAEIIPQVFDADLSLKLDAVHLLREELNERGTR